MNKLLLVTKVQLKEHFSTLFGMAVGTSSTTGSSKKKKSSSSAGGPVMAFLILAFLTGYFGNQLGQNFSGMFSVEVFTRMLLAGVGTITFFMAIPAVLSAYFGSSDLETLLTLPVTPTAIVGSKTVVALLSSYPFAFLVGIMPLVGYGAAVGGTPEFWISVLVIALFLPMLPFAYAAIIALILAALFKGLRSKDAISTLSAVVSIVFGIGIMMFSFAGGNSGSMIMSLGQSGGTSTMLSIFPAYLFAVEAMGGTLSSLGIYALISVAAFGILALIAHAFYLKAVTSMSTGSSKTATVDLDQDAKSPLKALRRIDRMRVTRSRALIISGVIYPVAIIAFLVGGLLVQVAPGLLAANPAELASAGVGNLVVIGFLPAALLMVFIASACSKLVASPVSREGASWDVMKTLPVSYTQQIRAKLSLGEKINFCIGFIIILIGCAACLIYLGASPISIVLIMLAYAGAVRTITAISAYGDLLKPAVDWGTDDELNTHVLKSQGNIFGIVACVLLAALPVLMLIFMPIDPMARVAILGVGYLACGILADRLLLGQSAKLLGRFEG